MSQDSDLEDLEEWDKIMIQQKRDKTRRPSFPVDSAAGGGGPDPKEYPGLFSDSEDDDEEPEIDPELLKQFFGEDEDDEEDHEEKYAFEVHVLAHGALLIPEHIQIRTEVDIKSFMEKIIAKLKDYGMFPFSNNWMSTAAPLGNPTITDSTPLCPCNRAMLAYDFETISNKVNKYIHENMTIEDYINYFVSRVKDFWRKKGYMSREITKRFYDDNPDYRNLFAVNRIRDLYKLIKTPTKVFVFETNSAKDGIERLKSDLKLKDHIQRSYLRNADYCENTINHPNYKDRFSCAEILSFYLGNRLFKFKRMFNLNEFSDLQRIFLFLECVTDSSIQMPSQFSIDFSNAVKQMYGLFNKSSIVADDYRLECKYKTVNGADFITQTNTLALNIQARMLIHYVKSKLADPHLQYDDLPYLDSFEGIKRELGVMDVTGFWIDGSCSVPHVPKTSDIDPSLLYNLGKSLEGSANSFSSQPLSEFGDSSQPSQSLFTEPESSNVVAAPKSEEDIITELATIMTPEEIDLLLNLSNAVQETVEQSAIHSFTEGIAFVPRQPIKIREEQMRARERNDTNETYNKYSRRINFMKRGGSKSKTRKSKTNKSKTKKRKTRKSKRTRRTKKTRKR